MYLAASVLRLWFLQHVGADGEWLSLLETSRCKEATLSGISTAGQCSSKEASGERSFFCLRETPYLTEAESI